MDEFHPLEQDTDEPVKSRVTRSQTSAASKLGFQIDKPKTTKPMAASLLTKSRKIGVGDSSNADTADQSPDTAYFAINKLPAEIILEILSHVSDVQSLLNCRLVCNSWRSLIDNNAALMRRFTFLITHPKQFLNWKKNVASHVRAIRLQLESCSVSQVKALFRKVGPTCEVLTFDMLPDDRTKIQPKVMLKLILSHFVALKELRTFCFIEGMRSSGPNVLPNFEDHRVKSLSIHLQSADPASFEESKIRLGHLGTIAGTVRPWKNLAPHVFQPVVEHMQNHPGVLKKLDLTGLPQHYSLPSDNNFMSIRLNAVVCGVQANLHPNIRLGEFLGLGPEDEALITPQNCAQFTEGRLLVYGDFPLQNCMRLVACTNMEQLDLILERNPSVEEMTFVRHLTKLNHLTLTGMYFRNNNFGIPAQAFGGELESLRTLTIMGQFQFSGHTPSVFHYFPNLTSVELRKIDLVPQELFVWLVDLEKLTKLTLQFLPNLSDSHLTAPYNSNGASDPVVAAFNCLKELKLESCPQLTKPCWVSVISCTSSSNSLEKLELIDLAELKQTPHSTFTRGDWKFQLIDNQLGHVILTKEELDAE